MQNSFLQQYTSDGDEVPNISTKEYFREILLTYRLIFSQDPRSREAFKREHWNDSREDSDPLLRAICSTDPGRDKDSRDFFGIDVDPPSRKYYASEFPFFAKRILELHLFIEAQ